MLTYPMSSQAAEGEEAGRCKEGTPLPLPTPYMVRATWASCSPLSVSFSLRYIFFILNPAFHVYVLIAILIQFQASTVLGT